MRTPLVANGNRRPGAAIIVVVLLLALAAAGCGRGKGGDAGNDAPPPTEIESEDVTAPDAGGSGGGGDSPGAGPRVGNSQLGPTATAWRGDVTLTLAVDRLSFAPGETIRVRAVVENKGSEPVSYTVCCTGYPVPMVYVDRGDGTAMELWAPQENRIYAMALETRELYQGRRLERTVVWDQKLPDHDGKNGVQARSGRYLLIASMPLDSAEGNGGIKGPLEAVLEVEIAPPVGS